MKPETEKTIVKGGVAALISAAQSAYPEYAPLMLVLSVAFTATSDTTIPVFVRHLRAMAGPGKIWSGPEPQLYEKFLAIDGAATSEKLFSPFNRSVATTDLISSSIVAFEIEHGEEKSQDLLDTLLRITTSNVANPAEWVQVIAAVLTRFSTRFRHSNELRDFYERYGSTEGLNLLPARTIPVVQCLTYICLENKMDGLNPAIIKRYMSDKECLLSDAEDGNSYYGSELASLRAAAGHVKSRPEYKHGQDAARILYLYPLFKNQPDARDDAIIVKHFLTKFLAQHGDFDAEFRKKLVDRLEKRKA